MNRSAPITAGGYDDFSFDMDTAYSELESATASLAGAWAAIRHADYEGHEYIADRLKVMLEGCQELMKKVERDRDGFSHLRRSRNPADWYLVN